MRYGLPFKGSKNAIAEWAVSELPKADVFVDLFCGGGAITHCAMLSGKYEQFVMNDIDGRLPQLFKECAWGKYTVDNHPEWVTREEFKAKKDEDADGYTKLYEFGREHSAVSTFMDFISWNTRHGGHTSAIRACKLMNLEWEADR